MKSVLHWCYRYRRFRPAYLDGYFFHIPFQKSVPTYSCTKCQFWTSKEEP